MRSFTLAALLAGCTTFPAPIPSNLTAPPPSGLVAFCERNKDFCTQETPINKAEGSDIAKILRSVNNQINRRLSPKSDQEIYGLEEYWTLPLTFGKSRFADCEDYVLEKRQELINRGIPASRLSIAVVHSPRTGLHAVLVYSGDNKFLVLDNMTDAILPWEFTNYTWIKISNTSLLNWVYFKRCKNV